MPEPLIEEETTGAGLSDHTLRGILSWAKEFFSDPYHRGRYAAWCEKHGYEYDLDDNSYAEADTYK